MLRFTATYGCSARHILLHDHCCMHPSPVKHGNPSTWRWTCCFFLEDYTFKEADYFCGYKTVFSLGIKGLRGIVSTPRGRVGGVGDRLWEHNISWMIKLIPQTHLLKINSEFKSQRSSLKHDNSRIVSISNWYHGASQWPQPRDEGQRSCFLKISWIFKFIAHI